MIFFRSFLYVIFFLLILPVSNRGQGLQRKALFLGNSYTYVNNMPFLTAALANSSGDSLLYGSNTPGGYTLGWQPIAHCTDSVSLAKIREHSWDFVILQEQSQTPAIPILRDSCMFPGALILSDSVISALPCARVLFFQTWGRRFGGIQCFVPNYCSTAFADFDQMQDSVTRSYKMVADSLSGWIAPAGEAWRLVISRYGMVLHDVDDSHPNIKGSYLTACVFYDCIFGKHSTGLSFMAGLPADTALLLQQAADSIVFGYAAYWNLWNDQPDARFTTQVVLDTMLTHNVSTLASEWLWDFGDGGTSTDFEPIHVYHQTGAYTVTLQACNPCRCDTFSSQVNIEYQGVGNTDRVKTGIRLIGPAGAETYRFEGFNGEGDVELLDINGKILFRSPVHSGRFQMNAIPAGIYFWKLRDMTTQKLYSGKILL
jgi:hypothetical protein